MRVADVKGAIVTAAQRYATEVREQRFPEAAQVSLLTPVKPAQNSSIAPILVAGVVARLFKRR